MKAEPDATRDTVVGHRGADPKRPTVRAAAGTTLGRYRLIRHLGEGGMGEVWEADDPELGRKVAVKILRGGRGGGRARLAREARAMAQLAHPDVITVFDVGDEDGQLFIAMELIDGGTLRAWLKARPPWRAVVARFVAAGRGLAAAHGVGLVHRDFKPDNVLLRSDGRVAVSDFGLARMEADGDSDTDPDPSESPEPASPLATITDAGTLLGTPVYMSPEQHLGRAATAASDQFAFCVTLWEAVYGERPFGPVQGEGLEPLAAIGLAIIEGRLQTPPRDARVPGWLRRVLTRGLRVEAGERHPSMAMLVAALQQGLARRRRIAISAAIGGAVAAAALTIALWPRAAAGPSCGAVGEQLAGIWDDGRRDRVRRGLRASGRAHAPATADRVIAALDDHAQQWIEMRGEACRASRVEGRQSAELLDLRNACLDRRRAGLDALAAQLSGAPDGEVADRAIAAAAGLASLAGCADATALRASVPLPADPAIRRQLESIYADLASVDALQSLARYREARDLAARAAERARATGHAPALALALAKRGELESDLGDYPTARVSLEEASQLAGDANDGAVAAEAGIMLLHVVGIGQDRAAEALAMRPLVDGLIRRAGDRVEDRVRFLSNTAGLLLETGDLEQARAVADDALALAEAGLGADHPALSDSLGGALTVATKQGRWTDAAALMQRQRALIERIYGPDHPAMANVLHRASQLLIRVGKHAEAEPLALRALEIRTAALGLDHDETAAAMQTVANIAAARGDREAARATYEQLLARARRVGEPEAIGHAMQGLGGLAKELGEREVATAYLAGALEYYAKAGGTETFDYAMAEYNLATSEVEVGRCDLARPRLDHIVAVLDRAGVAASIRAYPLLAYSTCELASGRHAEAIALAEQAIAGCGADGCSPLMIAVNRGTIGQAQWASGDRATGAKTLAVARAELEALPEAAPQLRQFDQWARDNGVPPTP